VIHGKMKYDMVKSHGGLIQFSNAPVKGAEIVTILPGNNNS